MPTNPKRTKRLDPAARREQILQATLTLVATEGFPAVSIGSVAEQAGITRPVIYDLFGDLDGLLDALAEIADQRALGGIEGALPTIDGSTPPDSVLGSALEIFLNAVRADPEVWRIVLMTPDGTPGSIRGRIERRRAEIGAIVSELVAEVLEPEATMAGVNPEMVGKLIIGIAEDFARLTLTDESFPPERLGAAAAGIARLLPLSGGGRE